MAKIKMINSNGFKLRYVREGSGIPLLIIGSSYYYPRIFSESFRQNYDCIFMDHRGFVASPGEVRNSEFELDILLNDIDLVRRDAQIDKAIIVGHSGHGYLALEYAKKYPHALGVVIIGTGPDQSDASHKLAEDYFNTLASEERKKALQNNVKFLAEELKKNPDRAMITMLIRLGAKSWYDYTFDSTYLWKDVVVNMKMFNYVWSGIFKNIDITQGLEVFDKPVLLALGKYDFIVAPPDSWNSLLPKFKNITVQLFERSGHTPQYEESELFDAKLNDWITSSIR